MFCQVKKDIKSGSVLYEDKDLFKLDIEERAQKGLFLAFQYPLEIPGVNTSNFKNIIKCNKKIKWEKTARCTGIFKSC